MTEHIRDLTEAARILSDGDRVEGRRYLMAWTGEDGPLHPPYFDPDGRFATPDAVLDGDHQYASRARRR